MFLKNPPEPLFKHVTKKADLAPNGGSGGVAAGGSSSLARSTDNMRGSLRSQGNDGSGTEGGDRNSRARLLGAATPDAPCHATLNFRSVRPSVYLYGHMPNYRPPFPVPPSLLFLHGPRL